RRARRAQCRAIVLWRPSAALEAIEPAPALHLNPRQGVRSRGRGVHFSESAPSLTKSTSRGLRKADKKSHKCCQGASANFGETAAGRSTHHPTSGLGWLRFSFYC